MSQQELENTLAQSLMAIGLYTVSFEATALSFRAKIYEYLSQQNSSLMSEFTKACKTAYATFDFCGPILVSRGIIEQADLDSLKEIRERRNLFAHEGYNRVFDLQIKEVLPDVRQLHRITAKVEHADLVPKQPSETVRAAVSPLFFSGFIRQIVEQMSYARIKLPE